MDAFQIRDLTFSYPGGTAPALSGLSLTVKKGDFLVLCGPSGGGKSTLLRLMKPILAPHGEQSGMVLFEGRPVRELSQREQSEKIAFVLQSPEDQTVTHRVWHELAFGLESLGYDTLTIRRRVAEMADFFGMEPWFHREVAALSGGQKQQLNLAAALVLQPEVLLLDEPTSQLDPIAAGEFLAMLGRIHRELGTTIVLSEHRLEEALPLATAAAVVERGQVTAFGTPLQVGRQLKERRDPMALAMPTPMRVWGAVDGGGECPLTAGEGRRWLEEYGSRHPLTPLPEEKLPTVPPSPVLEAKELWYRYEREGQDVLKGLSLEVRAGECLALLGGNGGGKTTALTLLAGLEKPQRGRVICSARIGLLPQDPKALFVKNTVGEDLESLGAPREKVDRVSVLCGLKGLLDRHPFDLSGGEQQRTALAKVLLTEPEVLLLDEPTKGMDVWSRRQLGQILTRLLGEGACVVLVSHDVDFCAQYAHRCALLFDGAVAAQGTPREFFSGNRFYTTAANRMARETLPGAVTAEELIIACGGRETTQFPKQTPPPHREAPSAPPEQRAVKRTALPHSTMAGMALSFLLIPLTLLAWNRWGDGRNYYLLALLVLGEGMLPLFLLFEGRRPRARELVVLAVLCAIGVAGRAAFFMLPQVKPVMALTIVSGAALGGESGFLVGAVTMLVSNLIFGQGPSTPWQMFAMGLVGGLAGLIFGPGRLKPARGRLTLFGTCAALGIYGVIMNVSSALFAGGGGNPGVILAYCAAGLPMDAIHAGATAAFLWFGAGPLLEKLTRAKQKYGLFETAGS